MPEEKDLRARIRKLEEQAKGQRKLSRWQRRIIDAQGSLLNDALSACRAYRKCATAYGESVLLADAVIAKYESEWRPNP